VESYVGEDMQFSSLHCSTPIEFHEAVDGAGCKEDEGWRSRDALQCNLLYVEISIAKKSYILMIPDSLFFKEVALLRRKQPEGKYISNILPNTIGRLIPKRTSSDTIATRHHLPSPIHRCRYHLLSQLGEVVAE
jgi:hypothetical protein